MSDAQQPGPSYQPPATPQPGPQWQGPAGLPPYGQRPRSEGRAKPLLVVLSGLVAAGLFMGAGILIGREMGRSESAGSAAPAATTAPTQQVAPGAEVPPNGTDGFGILIGGVSPSEDIPHVIVWEDPQCPACAQYEVHFGPVIADLVAQGRITAEARFAYFLDQGTPYGPSQRGAIAMAAADAVGHFDEYHSVLFERLNQGVRGYTDEMLVEFARDAGIDGGDLALFEELYAARAHEDFVTGSYEKFTVEEIAATPTFLVSGKRLQFFDDQSGEMLIAPEAESFLKGVTAAWEAGGQQIEAPPEPR